MKKRLALNEKTVYPRLAESIGADDLALHFTPTEEEIEFASLLALLKLFQKLHRFPDSQEVAPSIIDHLRIQLRLGTAVPFLFDDPVQRARQRNAIRQYTGVMGWSKKARHFAAEAGYEAALVMARHADITNAVVSALTFARFELPAFSTVERITKHARAMAHRKLCGSVFSPTHPARTSGSRPAAGHLC